MPSQNKTQHLDLNQWQGNEYPKRVDFVDDNLKIDTAVKNLSDQMETKETLTGAQTKADTAEANAKAYADAEVSNVAGVGRTVETVKKNAEDIANLNAQTTDLATNKVDKVAGKGLSTEDFTTTEKNKLADIPTDVNNYVHPSTHPANIITQDSIRRFVTDVEKSSWNAKETTTGAQAKVDAHANRTNNPHNVTATQLGASNILTQIRTVDGSGSGLDSDTVDGKHASELVNAISVGSNTDPNTTQQPYILTNHSNSPSSSVYWHIRTLFYSTKTGNRAQFAVQYNGGPDMYFRQYFNSSWSAWRKIWHNYNDGSSSGLDADLLDGKHSSYFEPAITKNSGFNLNKSDSVTSTSITTLATSKAAKTAYDKGIEALNIANNKLNANVYTASDVLEKIKTVDGEGSGLDADLLGGIKASQLNKLAYGYNSDSSSITISLSFQPYLVIELGRRSSHVNRGHVGFTVGDDIDNRRWIVDTIENDVDSAIDNWEFDHASIGTNNTRIRMRTRWIAIGL